MVFDPHDLDIDFFLLRDGPVWLVRDREVWDKGIPWLVDAKGYEHFAWSLDSENDFQRTVSTMFAWERQFGCENWKGNLDAFSDGLAFYEATQAKQIVLSVDNAHRLDEWQKAQASQIWQVLSDTSQQHLLFGIVVIVFVRTPDDAASRRWVDRSPIKALESGSFPFEAFKQRFRET